MYNDGGDGGFAHVYFIIMMVVAEFWAMIKLPRIRIIRAVSNAYNIYWGEDNNGRKDDGHAKTNARN